MSLSYCEGVITTFLGTSVRGSQLSLSPLGISSLANSRCARSFTADREAGMAVVPGRMSPRVSLALMRSPANPTLYGPARRGAALIC